jgi:hypothetical protein
MDCVGTIKKAGIPGLVIALLVSFMNPSDFRKTFKKRGKGSKGKLSIPLEPPHGHLPKNHSHDCLQKVRN